MRYDNYFMIIYAYIIIYKKNYGKLYNLNFSYNDIIYLGYYYLQYI